MDQKLIEMQRGIFGVWEPDFVARRRETAISRFGIGCYLAFFALALAGIAIYGK